MIFRFDFSCSFECLKFSNSGIPEALLLLEDLEKMPEVGLFQANKADLMACGLQTRKTIINYLSKSFSYEKMEMISFKSKKTLM